MSDPTKSGEAAVDPLVNIKAEFDRKLTNTETELKKTNDLLKTLLQNQTAAAAKPAMGKSQPPPLSDDDELATAWYRDEKKAASIVKKQAVDETLQILDRRDEAMNKRAKVIQDIQSEFPETYDQSHPLVLKANEYFAGYSDEEKATPSAMKLAIKEAALELGIKPRSKRTDADDTAFSFSGYSPSRPPAPRKQSTGISAETAELARLMKIDVKKVEERAKGNK